MSHCSHQLKKWTLDWFSESFLFFCGSYCVQSVLMIAAKVVDYNTEKFLSDRVK